MWWRKFTKEHKEHYFRELPKLIRKPMNTYKVVVKYRVVETVELDAKSEEEAGKLACEFREWVEKDYQSTDVEVVSVKKEK